MPPEGWKLPVIILLGIKAGLVTYLFYISKAPAYLSDDPRACVNCHVPHDHIFNTYYFKAKDGLRHATIFTLRKEPQVIFIKEEGKSVVLDNCISCHEHLLTDPWLQRVTDYYHSFPSERQCQVCHREETLRLVEDVYTRQDKIIENRDMLEELLVRAHVEAKLAWDLGANEAQMKEVLTLIRHAPWRWDYAAAGHGNSFHSPVETGRVISTGITKVQDARVKLARVLASLGQLEEIPYPDISTKAKAQAFIGLDAEKLQAEKQEFLNTVVKEWVEKTP